MNDKEFLLRKSAVYQMGLLFNQAPSDEKITAYANALMRFEPKQIIFAFNQVINSGTAFFPSLAEVLKHLRPTNESNQDKAPQIAQEVLNALRAYSQYDEVKMLENVSEDARMVFLAIGYTGDIRTSENYETTKAQIERLAKGVLASKEASVKNEKLEKIGINTGRVLEMKRPEMKTMDFSGYLPSGDPA